MPYIVDNETAAELARNHVMIKKVRRLNTIAFFAYLIGGIIMIPYAFTSMVGLSWDWLSVALDKTPLSNIAFFLIIDTVIVCPLSIYLTYRASLLHHDLSAIIVIALQTANYILMIVLYLRHFLDRLPIAFIAVTIYSLACIFTGAGNLWAVIKYHYLEKQQGFPQFNARYEEYKEDRFQRGIIDPYELRMKQIQKASTGEMNDLGVTQEKLEKYEEVHLPDSMDSI